jgi:hypothetical protein
MMMIVLDFSKALQENPFTELGFTFYRKNPIEIMNTKSEKFQVFFFSFSLSLSLSLSSLQILKSLRTKTILTFF